MGKQMFAVKTTTTEDLAAPAELPPFWTGTHQIN